MQGRGRGGQPGGKLRVVVSSPRAAASYLGGTLFLLAFLVSRWRERGGELEVAGRGGSAWLDNNEGAGLDAAHGAPDLDGGRPGQS
jgi:hypothetical protein